MTVSATGPEPAGRVPQDLPYNIPWRSRSVRAGAHRGTLVGAGGLFRDLATLLEHPDPRRIDLRASARDPYDALYVRRFEQKSAIAVYVLVDVSASMGFRGRTNKVGVAADLAQVLAASARRIGDAFGLIAFDSGVNAHLLFPATRSRAGEREMLDRLRAVRPSRRGVDGIAAAASLLTGQRKLVFLVSDFLIPADTIAAAFAALARHDIVPIVVTDSSELRGLPRWGLIRLRDSEDGRQRLFLMRPSLRESWLRQRADQRAAFNAIANRHGRRPFEVVDSIDWDRLGSHLMGG